MSQPVKLSDALVLDARLTAEVAERSIAGQIEFWAGLGKAIEPLLRMPEALALKRAGSTRPISECLAEPGTDPGSQRVITYLKSRPFPHYESDPESPGVLVRIDEDGTRIRGRFINRRFEPEDPR
jgi:hypothetical protein